MSKIGQNWPKQLFEQSKSSILDSLSHTTGIEFTDVKINSIAYHFNRFGSSAILDIQLYDEKDPEYNMSIAVIYKQLAEGVISSKVEKINSEFIQLLESRQNSWIVEKEKLNGTISFNENPEFPDLIFAPEIVYSDSENNYIGYSTLNRFVRRDKSGVLPLKRYKVMGYALARFHGTKFSSIKYDLYSKYFDFLLNRNIDQNIIEEWKHVLHQSKGGTDKFIFGDYAMECVQYNAISQGTGRLDSLCMFDPVLIDGGDRAEDLASILASLTKEKLVKYLRTNPEGSLREALTQTLRYLVTQSGKELIGMYINLIPNFLKNYDDFFPLDFFLGFFLIRAAFSIKNQAVLDESLRDMLIVLGEEFLSKRPFAEAYQV